MSAVEFRDLDGIAEFRVAEDLQRAVWGEDELVDPADLMMVIQLEGGLVAGAFEAGEMLGYVFGFPTREPNLQHSHRLAVHPRGRGGGLGVQLKWHQRDWCLARAITVVRWTFDPLRHINASLNIARLGAVASTYYPDYYGELPGINRGAPTDRLLAEWCLESGLVVARAAGARPDAERLDPLERRVAIPEDFGALLVADPEAAVAERLRVRALMLRHLGEGFTIRGYDTRRREYVFTGD